MKKEECQISHKQLSKSQLVPAIAVSDNLVSFIQSKGYNWDSNGYISISELNHFVKQKMQQMIEGGKIKVGPETIDVIESFTDHDIMTEDVDEDFEEQLTFAERLSDKLAAFGGSWTFILLFFLSILGWITCNIYLLKQPFDAYPFILLNLLLSCIAAVQAPIIMMSQNRQETRDRLRAKNDYKVNLKAELEIRQLHEKIDHLTKQISSK